MQPDSGMVIIDLPAAIPHARLHAYTCFADSVLLPIVPSEIDIYGATHGRRFKSLDKAIEYFNSIPTEY